MIRYGPAGIPLSCKGRTLKDGIEDVHNLALTALEIQMVRPKTFFRAPDEDEEVGKSIRELDGESGFVIGIDKGEDDIIYDPDVVIDEEDNLLEMASGIAYCFNDLYALGNMARRHDVALSLHTPYYMDLGGELYDDSYEMPEDDEYAEMPPETLSMQCFNTLRNGGVVLNALGGNVVVTNLGPYDPKRSREDTEANMMDNLSELMRWWKSMKLKPKLGVEVTGQQDVWGSLDQVLDLCDSFKGAVVPVLNFAQYQSRTKGSLITSTDFADLIAQFVPYSKDGVYSSFSNVEFDTEGNEKWLTPLKKGDLKFERLAECLADMMPEITLISSSPLLEHDAVYMRTLTERVLSKKAAKYLKDKKKSDEATAIANGTLAPADPNDEPEA